MIITRIIIKQHLGQDQLGACSRILGTVDQLWVDNNNMDEVRSRKKRKLEEEEKAKRTVWQDITG